MARGHPALATQAPPRRPPQQRAEHAGGWMARGHPALATQRRGQHPAGGVPGNWRWLPGGCSTRCSKTRRSCSVKGSPECSRQPRGEPGGRGRPRWPGPATPTCWSWCC